MPKSENGFVLNQIFINAERCKGCQLCIKACQQYLIYLADSFNDKGYSPATWSDPEEKCRCKIPLCFLMCPDVAIEVDKLIPATRKPKKEEKKDGKNNSA